MAQIPQMFKRNIALALLVCTLCSCAVGPRQPQVDARKELDAIKGPDVKGVTSTLKEQADAAMKSGAFNQAEALYKQLLDKDPANNDYRYAYADVLRREDKCPEAITAYDAILAGNKQNAPALEGKGLCVMGKGNSQEATRLFSEVMKVDPKRWRTLNAIGILFGMKGMTKEALAYYDEAMKYSPNAASVLNNVGLTQALNKNYDEAAKAFLKALSQLPDGSPDAKRIGLNLALTYGLAGKMDLAEKAASPFLSRAALYNNMGFYAHLAKDDVLAKSYLNMALSNSPVYYERAWDNLQDVSGRPGADKTRGGMEQPAQ